MGSLQRLLSFVLAKAKKYQVEVVMHTFQFCTLGAWGRSIAVSLKPNWAIV